MKRTHTLLAILLTVSATTRAQNVPAASGSATSDGAAEPQVSGKLHYDLRYAQTARVGSSMDGQQRSYISGDASYANIRKRTPFTLQYGGGYGWVWAGPPSAGNVYQHLALSQGYIKRTWSLLASEDVNYIFETPTTGFSGVPGTGEPIGGSTTTTSPDQTILAQNTRTLNNNTTLRFVQKLNHAISLNIGGAWSQLRFIDGYGQDMDSKMANVGITRRLNVRNSVSGQYSYSCFVYGSTGLTTKTNNGQFGFTRQWNRQLTTIIAAGPSWIAHSGIPSTGNSTTPSSAMLSFNASAKYVMRHGSAGLSYFRGTMGGSGYMLGAKEDSVNANYMRGFGRKLTVGLTGSYMRTSALTAAEFSYACTINGVTYLCYAPLNFTPVTQARYAGVQATRKLGRFINIFANYTAIEQSSSLQITVPNTPLGYNTNILNGLNQVISFGFGYSPREMHLNK